MTSPTQGEHAQTEALAHELFAAAQLAPGEGIEDAVSRIVAALTAAPEQLLSPTEQKWVLQSPAAIAQLLTFIDLDHSQAVSVLGAEEWEPWPPKRYTELKEIGRKVIEQDPECFDADILREFGFAAPAQPAAPHGVAYAELPDERAAFEAQFPVPGGVSWNGSNYVVKDDYLNSYRCDRFVGQWAAWQARASHGQAPAGAADNQRELLEDAAFLLRKYRRLCVEIGRGDSQHLDRIEAAAVAVRALYAEPTPTAQAAPAAGNWIAADDVKRLVRQLDVALNGEDGAAMQASLCDIVAQVEHESAKRGRPVLAAAPTPAAQADSVPQKETPDETLWQWYLANKDVEIPHSRAVALRVLQGAIRVFGNADSVPEAAALSQAARDVLAERKRQINAEGWTPEHDDEQHLPGELALAAASYVCADENDAPPAIWPWALNWWKPRDRRRNLTKAGALILAEMERIDRAARKQGGTHDS